MKTIKGQRDDKPSTVKQLAAAMTALGTYTGENSDVEHTVEAQRLGGMDAYQMLLANALLGSQHFYPPKSPLRGEYTPREYGYERYKRLLQEGYRG